MHVLFITPGFAKDEQDSVCIPPLQLLTKALAGKGVRISILALDYPYAKKNYSWNGIPVYACGGNNRRGFAKLRTLYDAWRMLRKIHAAQPIDLVHSFWLQDTAMLGARFAKKEKRPHLISLMGQDAQPENNYLERFDFDTRPFIVALSKFQRDVFQQSTGKAVNALTPLGIDALAVETGTASERDIDLLGAGWLSPVKRYDQFIRIVARLKAEGLQVKAVIAGDGTERQSLEELAKQLGVNDSIHFAGLCSREETLALMKRSKMLLHPSSYEGFGYVFAEALAAGAKIVSYAVGSAEAGERWLIGDSEETLAKAAAQFLHEPFTAKSIVRMTIEETAQHYLDHYTALQKASTTH